MRRAAFLYLIRVLTPGALLCSAVIWALLCVHWLYVSPSLHMPPVSDVCGTLFIWQWCRRPALVSSNGTPEDQVCSLTVSYILHKNWKALTRSSREQYDWLAPSGRNVVFFFSVRLHAKLCLQETGVDITSTFEDKITSGFAKVFHVSGNVFK